MELTEIEDMMVDAGGKFLTSAFDMRQRIKDIRAYVFDWDGVFNDGYGLSEGHSTYSKVDAMGLSLLRFGHFLSRLELPYCAIITGEDNPHCRAFAQKMHWDAVYTDVKDKGKALHHFAREFKLKPEQICYVFDDVLDLPVAREAGLRLAVTRPAMPVFSEYVEKHKLADYFTGSGSSEHAVRECCELLLLLHERHFECIQRRAAFDSYFEDYRQRNAQRAPQSLRYEDGNFLPA